MRKIEILILGALFCLLMGCQGADPFAIEDPCLDFQAENGPFQLDFLSPAFPVNAYAGHFFDGQKGLIGGQIYLGNAEDRSIGRLIRTADGGLNWDEVWTSDSLGVFGMAFPSPNQGFMIATGDLTNTPRIPLSRLYHSQDQGATWQALATFSTQQFSGLYFASDSVGFLWNDQNYFRSADGGQSWELIESFAFPVVQMDFPHPDTGFAAALLGKVYRSLDGGESWTIGNLGINQNVYTVHMETGQKGWVAGQRGFVMATEDAGLNWEIRREGLFDLFRLVKARNQLLIGVGPGHFSGEAGYSYGTLVWSIDAGQSWQSNPCLQNQAMRQLVPAGPETLYGFGIGAEIVKISLN
ncbi:MAG: YCF48-related protein [Bacteroidota bacterium]